MITTKRLCLRPFETSDVADVLAYTSQEQVAQDAGFVACETLEQALFFGKVLRDKNVLVIEHKALHKVIGNIGFYEVQTEDKLTYEVGYALNQDYWHQGYMSEALEAMLKDARKKNYQQIHARVAKRNQASIKLLERQGFKFVENYVVSEWFVAAENRAQLLFCKDLSNLG
ncbi:MAG: GNAT family N-acetyltransferase [Lactobacillus sp.]|nr:GNAT family N-acetyltransferase [Lactobacillus sp.]MBD5069237.1 GNAT family N-acetyltransferase [Lactobacillus sp.]